MVPIPPARAAQDAQAAVLVMEGKLVLADKEPMATGAWVVQRVAMAASEVPRVLEVPQGLEVPRAQGVLGEV